MKDMNWPERVAYLENQLADSDRDNQRLREFIEGLPDGDEIVRLRGLLAETNAKMMILHNESISLHARLAERDMQLKSYSARLAEAIECCTIKDNRNLWLEIRLKKIMARCADLLDEDQFNELDAIARATDSADGVQK